MSGLKYKAVVFGLIWLALLSWVRPVFSGRIEQVTDPETGVEKTVIHITLHDWIWQELDPVRTETAIRANAAAVKAFTRTFPKIFAETYRARYQADPSTYGRYNWDRVEVRVGKFSGIKIEGVESDLLAIAGRMSPDVIYLHFRKSDTYIQEGFLYPLDLPGDGYFESLTEDERAFRINPKILPVIKRRGPEGKSHVWALPHGGAQGKILIYRKDRFEEAGLDFPDETWTWDDLYQASRALTDPANGKYAVALRNTKHESYRWMDFLYSAGSDALTYDEEAGQWRVAFNNDQAVTALDYYVRLCTEPWTDAGGKKRYGFAYRDADFRAANAQWQIGNIAMVLGTIQENIFVSRFDPDIIGIAPFPIGPDGKRGSALNSKMMGLFAGIEERAVRDAAWEFIRYYESTEAVEIKTRMLVEGGLGRFVNPKYLRKFGYEELIRLAPRGWEETYNIAVEHSKPEPYGRHCNVIYDILDTPIKQANQRALSGKLPGEKEARRAELSILLDQAAEIAQREMLGFVPPDEMRKKRIGAAIFVTALVLLFAWAFKRIVKSYQPPAELIPQKPSLRKIMVPLLLLAPALLTILVWKYLPLLRGSVMAFQDYHVLKPTTWVWLDNFAEVLWDRTWWISVWNAFRYSFLVIALTFLPPVILAILLQEVPRGKILFRTLYYLPAVITSLVVILLWKSFYEPTENGALNRVIMSIPCLVYLLAGLGLLALCLLFAKRLLLHDSHGPAAISVVAGLILLASCIHLAWPILSFAEAPLWKRFFMTTPEPYRWLQDPTTAMLACVIPIFWAHLGPGCLIYLAALKGVPDDLYEAADMDGATFIDKILFIVFPIFKPLLIINFVGVFIGAWFYAEANILAMTGGQAGTEVAGLHIFYKAFMFLKFGPATAMAWILGFMLILFTMYQLRIMSRLEFRTADSPK